MTATIGTASGNKTVVNITVGTSSGNKAVLLGYVGTSGGNKLFFAALSATASPSGVSGANTLPAVTTNASTATPSGGFGPFTYSWAFVSGDAITVLSPTTASTAFRGSAMSVGEIRNAIFRCTVTDTATGFTAVTNDVAAEVERV